MTIIHKGAPIFYTDQGEGQPLLLLHGFLENQLMWEPFLPQLAVHHRVICIDLLGHGQSACTGYVHTMEEMAAAVKTVTDHLSIKELIIIGHSMGGYVGLAFTKAYPLHVQALCLLNSTPEPDDEERKNLRTRANQMVKTQYHQLVRMSFINLFDTETKRHHEAAINKALKQALLTPLQGYIAANTGMKLRPDNSTYWQQLTIKKGMILGVTDWIISAESHKEKYTKNDTYFQILKGGHMSHISNFEAVLEGIKEFIKAPSQA